MLFSVANNSLQWTLDFSTETATITVKDLVQNTTISSLEIPMPAFNSLINQRQAFLENHLAQVPITPNQQGTMEMRDEVLSTVGAVDSSSDYVPSDLEDIQSAWENPAADIDGTVFRPGIGTPFSPTSTFTDYNEWGSAENPVFIDDEEDQENTTPESQRPTEPPPLQRSFGRTFGTRMENVPDSVYRTLFH